MANFKQQASPVCFESKIKKNLLYVSTRRTVQTYINETKMSICWVLSSVSVEQNLYNNTRKLKHPRVDLT
jgi:hypothetical protein